MATSTTKLGNGRRIEAQPIVGQRGKVSQAFGTLTRLPLGLSDQARRESVSSLNELLADSIMLRDMYKKHHWQVSGPTFYALHLLFDKHAGEQVELVDALAERVQVLGGVSVAMGSDAAALSKIQSPDRGREEVPVQISRLLEAHEHILVEARKLAKRASEMGDDGTADLAISQVVRTNELEVWFVVEHLVDTPLVRAR